MIQRIQTIFLLLAGGGFGALLGLPFATRAPERQGIYSDGEYSTLDSLPLQILAIAGVVITLIVIFLFKKRPLQLKLGLLVIALAIAILAVAYFYLTSQSMTLTDAGTRISAGLFMPLVSVICVLLANRYIKKDERLVKSMDRLR